MSSSFADCSRDQAVITCTVWSLKRWRAGVRRRCRRGKEDTETVKWEAVVEVEQVLDVAREHMDSPCGEAEPVPAPPAELEAS